MDRTDLSIDAGRQEGKDVAGDLAFQLIVEIGKSGRKFACRPEATLAFVV